ncbi:hypothetical protein ML462_03635 [Gramella lutea]|uniref:Uncharacterized protein n=1 Tax=Christiangramia lutea TaxID=1607951 RepID=A0A9X1V144_9FLAO|nr:hypothetical protein [Christiangramia lutea]MCH4822255.1 hypothetical protein [Christiangramia lutea]
MPKEYFHAQFQLDGKKFKFKTDGENLTEVRIRIGFPNKFEVLKAYFLDEKTIKVDFVGYCGCTLADSIRESNDIKYDDYPVELQLKQNIPEIINVVFELTKVENCNNEKFVPETAGGGILVGTGG